MQVWRISRSQQPDYYFFVAKQKKIQPSRSVRIDADEIEYDQRKQHHSPFLSISLSVSLILPVDAPPSLSRRPSRIILADQLEIQFTYS